jgi:uncharacterized surface protein with fasciclin (FAS1) repeats
MISILRLLFLGLLVLVVDGFAPVTTRSSFSTSRLFAEGSGDSQLLVVKEYIQKYYPKFYQILDKNAAIWKALGSNEGFTVFCLSDASLDSSITPKQWEQLMDPRNLETTEKMGAYHVIGEVVTAEQLFDSGGVITMGGEVPIERTVKGGFFGFGGQEDGSTSVGGANVVESIPIGDGLVHEVDNLVSPKILWRYIDQLRIPGSK